MNAAEKNTFRILVIDDTAAIHDDFRKVLGATRADASELDALEAQLFGDAAAAASPALPRFEIDSAMQGQVGLQKLKLAIAEGRPYAMAFVDMRMPPGWDGVQTIRELWKVEPMLNVVICTAYSDYTPDQVAAELKLGGRMLILRKPFEKAEVRQLAATLCEKWEVGRQKAELERVIDARTAEFKYAAMHDSLTGLPNRALFTDRLDRTLLWSRREASHKFAVLFIDVDMFKVINDRLGHAAGDKVLFEISQRIQRSIRDVDTIARVEDPNLAANGDALTARLGGDEFAVILESIRADADAARVAQRILAAMDQPFVIGGHDLRCSASIGITTNAVDYARSEDMVRDADTAMYHAKREGRGQYAMFDQKMHDASVARLTFESDLRAAIERNGIVPFYQPIVDMATGHLVGFEALARWRHAIRGLISPIEFIPVAEESGLIVPLGLKILERACAQLVEWKRTLPDAKDLTMSVNLSRKQLSSEQLVRQIDGIIKRTGIEPNCLKLEITESCVMSDTRAATEVFKAIQRLGVQLHIDDFGTGFSSLSCLQTFPLDGLKIDRAFVKDIVENQTQLPLLRAIVILARGMNLKLVTEGVETPAQEALLKSLGCDLAQGYLYSKPMEAEHAFRFISNHNATAADSRAA